ncbi:MAG: KpsF/GutQ family sugar-phosphate isomerase, partial [Bacteroidia bacterium]|nr:KpsF/GutQ family sugar-phosphate isomerase [Bacteroidia bacterium]NNM15212.1 KpsF/GutQ family sugar-phosphate isomerase [Bacteroidia bacterium]
MSENQIIKLAKKTIREESKSAENLVNFIDKDFVKSVKLIFSSKGRVVVTGIGKSAIVANKLVATLNSTGTPAIFMHAADAIHGDLGIIQKNDIVICISKSGNTPEIKVLVPLLKNSGNALIAIVGDKNSLLGQQANLVLNTWVAKEACPNNLAPTSSTAAQMIMGDALAICLLQYRGFTEKDFARFHPGGSLGKKLYLKVCDIYPKNSVPKVKPTDSLKKVIIEISSNRLGIAAVIEKGRIIGVVTDGDVRRMLQKESDINKVKAKDIMTKKPKSVEKDAMAIDALQVMKKHNIT